MSDRPTVCSLPKKGRAMPDAADTAQFIIAYTARNSTKKWAVCPP